MTQIPGGDLVFRAFILVRNFESTSDGLEFGEFTFSRVGHRFKQLRNVFSSDDVNEDDWFFEKSYTQLPTGGTPGSPVGGIPNDAEDILLLLRLYKSGEISFVRLAIAPPSGNVLVQVPYRAMNDLNSYSTPKFKVGPDERQLWKVFADGVRESQSWTSGWFATSRRFFLSGGAKQFNPKRDDVDRIVDYVTALESTLVPEKDYNTRRITRRAAELIAPGDPAEKHRIVKFMTNLYDIRSRIVHGSGLDEKSRKWLTENCAQVELRVRQVLVAAVQKLPPLDEDRRIVLAGLYDPTDQDRGTVAFEKFREIKTVSVRKAVAGKIARLAEQ